MKRTPYLIRVIALTLLLIALLALIVYQTSRSPGTPADTASFPTVSAPAEESGEGLLSSAPN